MLFANFWSEKNGTRHILVPLILCGGISLSLCEPSPQSAN
jgi:hypothetical protein